MPHIVSLRATAALLLTSQTRLSHELWSSISSTEAGSWPVSAHGASQLFRPRRKMRCKWHGRCSFRKCWNLLPLSLLQHTCVRLKSGSRLPWRIGTLIHAMHAIATRHHAKLLKCWHVYLTKGKQPGLIRTFGTPGGHLYGHSELGHMSLVYSDLCPCLFMHSMHDSPPPLQKPTGQGAQNAPPKPSGQGARAETSPSSPCINNRTSSCNRPPHSLPEPPPFTLISKLLETWPCGLPAPSFIHPRPTKPPPPAPLHVFKLH